jgi:hypothetical protein
VLPAWFQVSRARQYAGGPMAQIKVVTEQVAAAAAKIARVPDTLTGGGGMVGMSAGAAADTPAAGAYDAMVHAWSNAAGAYGEAAAGLSRAVAAAAECYREADRLPDPSGS